MSDCAACRSVVNALVFIFTVGVFLFGYDIATKLQPMIHNASDFWFMVFIFVSIGVTVSAYIPTVVRMMARELVVCDKCLK